MLRSLMRGVGLGAGMSIGQELVGSVFQHVRNRGQHNHAGHWDIQCSCGALNTEDSRFCGSCGTSLVARCTLSEGTTCACGFVNAREQKFCSDCGTRL